MAAITSKVDARHMEDGNSISPSASEKVRGVGVEDGSETQNLKLDKHGLPLNPQPSDRKDDPLVCRCISVASFRV
jgi:hypothetical protein